MIRKNTWIVLLLLALLVGFSFYWQNRKSQQAAQATPTLSSAAVFSSTEGPLRDLKITSSLGTFVEVARDQTGKWVLKAPIEAAADQGAAEAAATQIGALRVLATVDLGAEIVGLDKPAYTMIVEFGTGKTHKLTIGSVTPVQTGYYVQLDAGKNEVVDKPGLDAILGLLTQPPYLATPTSVASPTPSPEPSTSTPAATPVVATAQPAAATSTP
jgi:hypothetical protein